ncbi:MAG: aromatic ring-hydroxylating dioxygenase subunit alpha [Verrucomicrobia bacterium]|nr:aromatic ring-hydroxylating dioxygenase subunit alpha [Verrucomicrobiota bacterium]
MTSTLSTPVQKKADLHLFPNGWYQVAWSDEVKPKGIKTIHFFGRDFIVVRGEDRKAHIYDPYCPHLGAHLGEGGKVTGNTIQCPFHSWSYNLDSGHCQSIPYCEKIPKRAQLKSYPVIERHGILFMYYHAQQEIPSQDLQNLPELDSNEWVLSKKMTLQCRGILRDVMENIADIAHFKYIHGGDIIPESDIQIEDNVFHCNLTNTVTYFGKTLPAKTKLSVLQPGLLFVRILSPMDFMFLSGATPIKKDEFKLNVMIFLRKSNIASRAIKNLLISYELKRQLEEDFKIIANRAQQHASLFCAADGSLVRFRKWYEQFFSPMEEI